jgi:hypothetical protein
MDENHITPQGAYRNEIDDKPTYEEMRYWRDHLLGVGRA